MLRLKEGTREYRKFKKKRLNLEDVIKYETIAQVNDSVLNLVAMNENQRIDYFQKYIDKLKIEDELKAKLEAEKAEKEANIAANNSKPGALPGFNPNPASSLNPPVKGSPNLLPPSSASNEQSNFYFYNPVTVSFGKREFETKWGKRSLKINWRLSVDKSIGNFDNQQEEQIVINDSLVNQLEEKYTVDFYTSKIPTSQVVIDSLSKERNFAYYQLGVIYKEKFKEYELAASRLEQLLKNNPEERLILPAKYNLFKIYEIINPTKAVVYKNQIIAEYPDSRYAQIVQNPSIELTDNESPDKVYYNLYKLFQDNAIREASEEVEFRINQFFGDESLPKFELLKANINGRLEGVDAYKKALNFVALSYPDELEGKQAENLLQNDIPKLEAYELGKLKPTSWKVIFPKDFPLKEDAKKLFEKINKYIKDRNSVLLKPSIDLYTADKDFIVIHGFDNQENAKSVLSVLQEFKDYKIKDKAYIISSEDYKIIQFKKSFNEWLTLNKQ